MKKNDKTLKLKNKITDYPTKKNDMKSISETKELNGPKGLEPTRYGDWEKNGRCSDF